jgi:hypothetical protein
MKATELRIGNWVNGEFANGELKPFQIFRIDGNDDCSGLEPIPLTPELLEKCGFKKWKGRVMENTNIWMKKYEHEAGYFDVDNKPVINTSTIGIRQYYGHSLPDEFFYTDHHSKIEYLHQLQNLYYALTGEELEINL